MSRYRKTMRQAIEEGLSNMQIAILKKEYAPFKGKTISAARAKQLMNILDKFKEADLKKLGNENIPFVSSGSRSKLAVRNMKFKVTNINPFKEEVTQEDFDLEEGKMKTIATMFDQGKSAEEIAKAMKLPVNTVKNILGEEKEEQLHEFKKMTVTFKSMDDMSKASTDLAKQGFTINAKGMVMKVDGKGDDLNKYGTDLQNFYKAKVKAEENAMSLTDLERMKKAGLKTKKEEVETHPSKEMFESLAALKKKADKSGMPYSILKKVFDRGMAAWKGGHRPGASQHQWAYARVNSFVTKSSGTWGGADKDLAAKVKGE